MKEDLISFYVTDEETEAQKSEISHPKSVYKRRIWNSKPDVRHCKTEERIQKSLTFPPLPPPYQGYKKADDKW